MAFVKVAPFGSSAATRQAAKRSRSEAGSHLKAGPLVGVPMMMATEFLEMIEAGRMLRNVVEMLRCRGVGLEVEDLCVVQGSFWKEGGRT